MPHFDARGTRVIQGENAFYTLFCASLAQGASKFAGIVKTVHTAPRPSPTLLFPHRIKKKYELIIPHVREGEVSKKRAQVFFGSFLRQSHLCVRVRVFSSPYFALIEQYKV